MIRLLYLGLAVSLMVLCASCTVIVGDFVTERIKPGMLEETVQCAPFTPPIIRGIPSVPTIDDKTLSSRDATETILIDKIDELRRYSKEIKLAYQNAYNDHLKTCR